MASGEMSEAEFAGFLSRACSFLARYSVDGSLHFICMDWRHLGEILAAGLEAYGELKNVCVWAKDSAGMGLSIGASTNWFSFSSTAAGAIETMFNWANTAAIAATSGVTQE
jgi:hypothetical protein